MPELCADTFPNIHVQHEIAGGCSVVSCNRECKNLGIYSFLNETLARDMLGIRKVSQYITLIIFTADWEAMAGIQAEVELGRHLAK